MEVDHGTGVGTVYRASVALCLFGVFASIPELARLAYLGLGFWLPQRLSEKTLRSG